MTRMVPNPPIKGHKLLFAGKAIAQWSGSANTPEYLGGCECGARPPDWPFMSERAVKRWHREHKAELLRTMEEPAQEF